VFSRAFCRVPGLPCQATRIVIGEVCEGVGEGEGEGEGGGEGGLRLVATLNAVPARQPSAVSAIGFTFTFTFTLTLTTDH
jgi:hypothetical protein